MTRINMQETRNIAGTRESLAWGKLKTIHNNLSGNINALIFAAVLIVCSVTVGCSSEKPKFVSAHNEIPMTQAQSQSAIVPVPAPVMQAENKPAPKKILHKKPATVNYSDKNYGVSFEYPRRYAIETGDAAAEVLTTSPIPMNFVAPGGVALATVELPETGFANTDFSSAFFNVSVHKGLTADQCSEFAVPQPKIQAASAPVQPASNQTAAADTKPSAAASEQPAAANSQSAIAQTPSTTATVATTSTDSKPESQQDSSSESDSSAPKQAEPQGSKLMVGDLELRGTEAVSGEGTRQSDAKYFHVYQNGACYEFGLNVTTVASEDGMMKHVDRDRVFSRLEKILDTVKINAVTAPEVTAEAPAAASTPATQNPAQ